MNRLTRIRDSFTFLACLLVLVGTLANRAFVQSLPAPTLSSLNPSTAQQFGPGFTLTINGAGFVVPGITLSQQVFFGNTLLFPSNVTPTQITVEVPSSELLTAGIKQVSVNVEISIPGNSLRAKRGKRLAATSRMVLSNSLSFTVRPALQASCSIPPGVTGVSYNNSFPVSGGTPPYTVALTSGSLPPGLNLAGQFVFGIPSAAGFYFFSLEVRDSASNVVSLSECGMSVEPPPFTAACPASPAFVGVPYGSSFGISGGVPPYSVQTSGSLPPGLTFNPSTNAISGTPTTAGNYSLFAAISDSSPGSSQNQIFLEECSINVLAEPPMTASCVTGPGQIGTSYTGSIQVDGGIGPLEFSISSGLLPAGLQLDSQTGAITGTPQAGGTTNFTAAVVDSEQNSASTQCSITIGGAPLTAACAVADPSLGVPFSGAITASGGSTPYQFELISGELPAGLELNATTGIVSGTPQSTGPYSFQARVTDATNATASTECSGQVNPALLTAACATGPGQVGVLYSGNIAAQGGVPGYSFALTNGSLPAGLVLDPTTGSITGAPTTTGDSSFGVTATDSEGHTALAQCGITISSSPLTAACSTGPGQVGTNYSGSVTVSGATGAITFSLAGGGIPPGLSLNSAQGTLTGTPTSSGLFRVLVRATDTTQATAVADCSIQIQPRESTGQSLTLGCPVSSASIGQEYTSPIPISGGTGTYTFRLTGGLPNGLSLDSGRISGLPDQPGISRFSLTATDSAGASQTVQCTLRVNPPPLVAACPAGISLPAGTVGKLYASTLTASGGIPGYQWSLDNGFIPPPGLSLTSAGVVTGTPTESGEFILGATVQDSAPLDLRQRRRIQCSVQIAAAPLLATGKCSLPSGLVGRPYPSLAPPTASGGTPPYQWTLASGQVPPGLTFGPDGFISGTPLEAGAFAFTTSVTDSGAGSDRQSALVPCELQINLTGLQGSAPQRTARAGESYSGLVGVQGGGAPYHWSVIEGSLPPGLELDPDTGLITGVATQPGSYSFVVLVTDSGAGDRQQSIRIPARIDVVNPLAVSCPTAEARLNEAYSSTATAAGGLAPLTWELESGNLPNGLSLSPVSGNIIGVPNTAGQFEFGVLVQDAATGNLRQSARASCHVTVTDIPRPNPNPSITGTSSTPSPTDPASVQVSIAETVPTTLTGVLEITFTPDAEGVSSGYFDPALQFASGGRRMTFLIAEGATVANLPAQGAIQQGTVAGTILVRMVALQGYDGRDLLPSPAPEFTIRVARIAPVIVPGSVVIQNVQPTSFEVRLLAFSNTRELRSGRFEFRPPGAAPISIDVDLSQRARDWYTSAAGQAAGSLFELKVPFTYDGPAGSLGSVLVTLTNSVGSSTPVPSLQ